MSLEPKLTVLPSLKTLELLNGRQYLLRVARHLHLSPGLGDLAVGISTSGRSRNVILALEAARGMGLTAAALSGRDGGEFIGVADPLLIVPSQTTARIQEMHIMLGQMLCGALERGLGLV